MDGAAVEHLREDALFRHDALAHGLVDRAAGVALLADLRELQNDVVAAEARAERQRAEVDARDDEVFPKGPVRHLRAARAKGFDLVEGQQRHLPVPVAGVGVVFDAPVGDEIRRADVRLLRPLF